MTLAGGCGITSRQAQIRQWIGRSELELIAEWGQPARIERNREGQKVMVYEWTTERWEEEGRMWTDSSGVTHWTAPRSRRVTTVEVRRFVVYRFVQGRPRRNGATPWPNRGSRQPMGARNGR